MRLLASVLTRFVQKGTLNIVAADGRRHLFEGKSPGPCLTIRLHDRSLHTRLALNPELYAGEAYMNGTLTFEDGSNVGDCKRRSKNPSPKRPDRPVAPE